MFKWTEEDGVVGRILNQITKAIETDGEEKNDLEVIEEIYSIITKAHEEGLI